MKSHPLDVAAATGDAGGPDGDRWFEAFFDAHAVRTARLAHLLGSRDPEDVAQEAFVRLLRARPRLAPRVDLRQYLNRIVVNEVRDRHRREVTARRARHLFPATATALGPEAGVVGSDILSALGDLPQAQRETVVLHYWSDLPLTEIANLTGRPLPTVKSHHRRALRRLQSSLGEHRWTN